MIYSIYELLNEAEDVFETSSPDLLASHSHLVLWRSVQTHYVEEILGYTVGLVNDTSNPNSWFAEFDCDNNYNCIPASISCSDYSVLSSCHGNSGYSVTMKQYHFSLYTWSCTQVLMLTSWRRTFELHLRSGNCMLMKLVINILSFWSLQH